MGTQDKNQGQKSQHDRTQTDTGQAQTGQPQTDQTQLGQRKPDWDKDQGRTPSQHDWQGQGTDDMEQGKATDPAQPSGTTPLERDQRPINQSR